LAASTSPSMGAATMIRDIMGGECRVQPADKKVK
jgi:hypothetical protein